MNFGLTLVQILRTLVTCPHMLRIILKSRTAELRCQLEHCLLTYSAYLNLVMSTQRHFSNTRRIFFNRADEKKSKIFHDLQVLFYRAKISSTGGLCVAACGWYFCSPCSETGPWCLYLYSPEARWMFPGSSFATSRQQISSWAFI